MKNDAVQILGSLLAVLIDPRQSKSALAAGAKVITNKTGVGAVAILTVPSGDEVLNLVASEGLTPSQFRKLNGLASKDSMMHLKDGLRPEIVDAPSPLFQQSDKEKDSSERRMISSPIRIGEKAAGLLLLIDEDEVKLSRLLDVAEALSDQQHSQRKHRLRVVERLHQFGILGPQSIAAHCVHVNRREMDLLSETQTAVVHNP